VLPVFEVLRGQLVPRDVLARVGLRETEACEVSEV
jgi:hypothetical protein